MTQRVLLTAAHATAALLLAGTLGALLLAGGLPAPDPTPAVPSPTSLPPETGVDASATQGPALRTAAWPTPSATAPEQFSPEARPPFADHAFVHDEAGMPIQAAVIWFRHRQDGRRVPSRGAIRTDADGRFEIPAAAAEMDEIWVRRQGFARYVGSCDRAAFGGRPIVITLERLAVLEGAVRDANGAPAGYLQVSVHRMNDDGSAGARVEVRSMANDGRWRFAVHPGRYRVDIAGQAGPIATRMMAARAGSPIRWDLELPADTFVRGRVVPPIALREAELEILLFTGKDDAIDAENGSLGNEMLPPTDRTFRLQVPRDGTPYWLVVHEQSIHEGLPLWVGGPYRGARAMGTLCLPENAARRSTVAGQTWIVEPLDVEDEDEESALDVARRTTYTIHLEDARGFDTWQHVYGGAANFRFTRVPAGRYTLRVTAYPDHELMRRSLNVMEGEEYRIRLE